MNPVRVRMGTVIATLLIFGWLAAMNFIPQSTRHASSFLSDDAMRLGLDLRGGIQWVIGVQLGAAEKHEIDYLSGVVENWTKDEKVQVGKIDVHDNEIVVTGLTPDGAEKLRSWAKDRGGLDVASEQGDEIDLTLGKRSRDSVRDRAMSQVLEVLRRRIDDPVTGIPESVVTRQGEDRILVQIPGGEIERERAGDLLKVTGHLEFKLVKDHAQTEALLKAKHPDGLPEHTEIAFERDKTSNRVLQAYLVPDKAALTGEYLTDARVQFDRTGRPVVGFTFNAEGGRIFGDLTRANIGQQLAILLDNRIYSAPTIRSQITMHGQIEGRFTPQEAADLAVVLRAGSLSVPVKIEEERTVGPALGADSIASGVNASVLGLVVVLLFCMVYYRLSGVYAGIALVVNLVLLVGVMSMFQATLTLPGLAGIVLTVGMAVDANVLVFERIREELRAGRTPRAAVSAGFGKAFWTILDANITTLISALVLYEYGTGPIKGFAVTLSIGVVTSVFAALVVTRSMFDFYPGTRAIHKLSI